MSWPVLRDCPQFALFEDTLADDASLMLLHGLVHSIEVRDPASLPAAWASLEQAQAQGHWVALAVRYELGQVLEPALQIQAGAASCLLQAWVFQARLCLAGDEVARFWQVQLAALSGQEADAGLLSLHPQWSEAEHAQACQRILDWIKAGDCYQVNLTMPFDGQAYGHPLALYARLRARQPVPYATLMAHQGDWILSLSPELFVQRQGTRLTCRPMKGTAPRRADPQADQAEAQALLASDKNRAENLMIVDLIRNDLGRLAPAGGVTTSRLFELEPYATVYQLTSTVQAEPVQASVSEVFQAIFPCGSITGAPKIRAMQIIAELEPNARGVYCGALGYLAPSGDFRFSVPIRTLLLSADGACRLNTGGGIVADSLPAEEYEECLIKARFARQLTEAYQLIETLRCEDGRFPLLAGHLVRLARSARALGFRCDLQAIEQALTLHAEARATGCWRVRCLLGRDGGFEIQFFPLEALAGEQYVSFASMRLNPADPRLRHKTTVRSFYDGALKQALADGRFDLLFLNTRGEVCEGARSNLFIERAGQILTPPLACGLLPGVLRAQLIETGQAQEAVLQGEDVRRATRIWCGNALRGLVPVRLAEE